jgi:hypothetical protein
MKGTSPVLLDEGNRRIECVVTQQLVSHCFNVHDDPIEQHLLLESVVCGPFKWDSILWL